MKLTPALTVLAFAAPAMSQTPAAKPPVHHTPVHRATTGACADAPALSPDIPKVPGCPKTLYALKYIDTVIGTGPLAEPQKLYTVHYTGYLLDGKKFDSSLDRKEPITFPVGLHRVITGWDTGFAGMHIGGKRRLFIPYQLAYGDSGRPPVIPAKSVLIFDLELLDQKDLPQQPTPSQPRPVSPPPAGTPAQPKPLTSPSSATPPASTTPPPAPGAIPTPPPASNTPGSTPGTAPKPADPTKPTTVPPPTDPTKPATTPPATTPTPSV